MPTIGACGDQILILVKECDNGLFYLGTDENDCWVWYNHNQICENKNRLNVYLSDFYVEQGLKIIKQHYPNDTIKVYKYCCDGPTVPDCSGGPYHDITECQTNSDVWSEW